jgi:hypothetical protein
LKGTAKVAGSNHNNKQRKPGNMAKRPKVNSTTGTANAGPRNKLRGRILKNRNGRAKVAARRNLPKGEHPKPKKANRDQSRSGVSAHTVTLSEPAMEALQAETLKAQEEVKAKIKKEDKRAFDSSDILMSTAKYRVLGKKNTSKFAPKVRIAEGHLPHLLKLEDEKKFKDVLELTLEMSVGNEWHVMTHLEFFAQAREQLAVPA